MKRQYIPLDRVITKPLNSNSRASIDYMKLHLGETGHKVVPVLVRTHGDDFLCLDGAKRVAAYRELGLWQNIEAFVGTDEDDSVVFEGQTMWCRDNGQHFIRGLLECEEGKRVSETVLAQSENLKIELRENIHLHYKNVRFVLGRRDFLLLADAIEQIEV